MTLIPNLVVRKVYARSDEWPELLRGSYWFLRGLDLVTKYCGATHFCDLECVMAAFWSYKSLSVKAYMTLQLHALTIQVYGCTFTFRGVIQTLISDHLLRILLGDAREIVSH